MLVKVAPAVEFYKLRVMMYKNSQFIEAKRRINKSINLAINGSRNG